MEKISKNEFVGVITNIKNEIRTTQIRTAQQVNSNLIMMYFRIGKILHENSIKNIYFIRNVSTELRLEFPNMRGFSEVNLRRMRKFYEEYKGDKARSQLVTELSWGHNILLLSKIKDKQIRETYMRATIENGWSRNVLAMQIENKYHERIGRSSNNFKHALPPEDSDLVNNMVKDPYIFDFLTLREGYKEKELESAMIERIRDVLLELGNGWSFVGNQYKLTVEGEDYYIDLLFYHLKLKCYIVVELKATKFVPEFVGKMNFYLAAVDDLVKSDTDNPSIGLILCKDKSKLTAQYALKKTGSPIGVSSYQINKLIPQNVLDELPTEDDLNLHIDLGEDD